MCIHARDVHGRTWELLLRAWHPPAATQAAELPARLLLLEQAGGFLRDRGARPGDLFTLSKAEDEDLVSMEVTLFLNLKS